MEQVTVRALRAHTAEVIARVERGEVVEVTNRGRPVARLVPIPVDPADLVSDAAIPPTATGPIPVPQAAAEPGPEAGALISALRDEERW